MKALRLFCLAVLCSAAAAAPHTPKPGSPERVAICDALRVYVIDVHAQAKPKQKIVFKIDYLKVEGDFAFFEGRPVYADGSAVLYDCLMDMDYSFLLQKEAGRWRVLADFCGTDVPPEDWWRSVARRLPADLPRAIIPDSYRRLLGV